MDIAADRMKRYYDHKVHEAPTLEPGDRVYLEGTNIRTKQPSKKLTRKRYGPFKVLERIGTLNYRLELPNDWKIHNVFHIMLLTKAQPDRIPGRIQIQPPNPPVLPPRVHEEGFEIERVLDSRINRKGKLEYQIKWKGYTNAHNSWEPADFDHLDMMDPVFEAFHVEHPTKPRLTIASLLQRVPYRYQEALPCIANQRLFDWTI